MPYIRPRRIERNFKYANELLARIREIMAERKALEAELADPETDYTRRVICNAMIEDGFTEEIVIWKVLKKR